MVSPKLRIKEATLERVASAWFPAPLTSLVLNRIKYTDGDREYYLVLSGLPE